MLLIPTLKTQSISMMGCRLVQKLKATSLASISGRSGLDRVETFRQRVSEREFNREASDRFK